MTIEVGKPAPDFVLNDQHGKARSLKEFRGKDVIIYFYPKDNTLGCTKQACSFRNIWEDIIATGAVVLGVSPDNSKSHTRFINKHELPFDLLCDPDMLMMAEYDAYREKMPDGIKKLGVIRSIGVIRSTIWIGPDGNVVKHWKKVNGMSDHPEHVLKALAGK